MKHITAINAAIQGWLHHQLENSTIPGFSYTVAIEHNVIATFHYGFANLDQKLPVTNKIGFHLGSQTKLYTAYLALRLHELECIDLNWTIGDILGDNLKYKLARISILQLLTHRAGLQRDWLSEAGTPTQDQSFYQDVSSATILSNLNNCDLLIEPDTQTKYSNVGYSLLGIILEKITNQPFDDLVELHINKRLKTRFATIKHFQDSIATCYGPANNRVRKAIPGIQPSASATSSGLCGTTEDCAKFSAALFDGELLTAQSKKLINENFFPMMGLSGSQYGIGMSKARIHNATYVGHAGEYGGCCTQTFYIAEGNLTISCAMNCSDSELSKQICSSIVELYLYLLRTFQNAEFVYLSGLLASNSGSSAVIADKKTAIWFSYDSWSPQRSAALLVGNFEAGFKARFANGYWHNLETHNLLVQDTNIIAIKVGNCLAKAVD